MHARAATVSAYYLGGAWHEELIEGQRADSHGLLTAQQHGAYPLPGHTDTLDTPTYFHSARRIVTPPNGVHTAILPYYVYRYSTVHPHALPMRAGQRHPPAQPTYQIPQLSDSTSLRFHWVPQLSEDSTALSNSDSTALKIPQLLRKQQSASAKVSYIEYFVGIPRADGEFFRSKINIWIRKLKSWQYPANKIWRSLALSGRAASGRAACGRGRRIHTSRGIPAAPRPRSPRDLRNGSSPAGCRAGAAAAWRWACPTWPASAPAKT